MKKYEKYLPFGSIAVKKDLVNKVLILRNSGWPPWWPAVPIPELVAKKDDRTPFAETLDHCCYP
ncbi:hypothetical protein ACFSZS_05215 [Seohaeicola zhoushanensis]